MSGEYQRAGLEWAGVPTYNISIALLETYEDVEHFELPPKGLEEDQTPVVITALRREFYSVATSFEELPWGQNWQMEHSSAKLHGYQFAPWISLDVVFQHLDDVLKDV